MKLAVWLILAIGLVFVGASAFTLWTRDDPEGNVIDRATELWAHEVMIRGAEGVIVAPFTTDGCSGGMSAAWNQLADDFPEIAESLGTSLPWEQCCVAHDRVYHSAGGAMTAKQSFQFRRVADQELRACVATSNQSGTGTLLADAIYLAVRAGGAPCTGLEWRWGYGFPVCFDQQEQ